jgi:ribonuclease P protein component
MKRFGLPRKARIVLGRDFDRVRSRGRRLEAFPLRLRALVRGRGHKSRLGLAVGRKVGGAAVRHRWKRAIREAFRLNRHRLRRPYDLVVSVCWGASPGEVRGVEDALRRLIEGLNAGDEGNTLSDSPA